MSGSALESLFLSARDREAAAGRWCAVTVAVLAVFHGLLLTPFLASADRRAADAAELDRVTEAAAGLAELASELDRPPAVADEVMSPALDRLVVDLENDLARLAATHRSLRNFVAAQRGGQPATPSGGEADEAEPFHVEDVDRILAVGEASTRRDLLAALRPLFEERIAGPRFMDLGELWKSAARPRIEADLDAAAARVTELRGRAPEAPWDTLAEALVSQRRTVRDLVWAPPERPDWWSSEPAAEAPEELGALTLEPAVAQQLRQPLALDQLRAAFTRTDTAFRDLVSEVGRRRTELGRNLDPEGLPEVLDGLGMGRVAGVFPLVLGLALAACFAAGARRRRELGILTHLLTGGGRAPRLREWHSMTFAGSSPRLVLLALAAVAWVGFATAQLWSVEPVQRLAALTAVGVLALVVAVAYALTAARTVHRLLAARRPTRDHQAPAEEDDQTLDWDTLRR